MLRISRTLLTLSAFAAPALADIDTAFESPEYNGSAAGTSMAGQQGWYTPNVAGSVDYTIMTYAGNAFGLPANPDGAAQFAAGRSLGGTSYARAQKDHDFSTSDTWCLSWDFLGRYDGAAPATHNLGSFSFQPTGTQAAPESRLFIALNTFVDLANPTTWSAGYVVHDAAGIQVNQPGLFAGPEWQNLPVDTWFRQTTEINLTENRITRVTITNLATGGTAAAEPAGWYLGGGATPSLPLSTSIRFFAGGTTAGNIAAWDNLRLVPTCGAPPCRGDLDGDADVDIQDLATLLANFGTPGGAGADQGDLDGDGDVDLQDLAGLLGAFGSNC